jgi:hypothetical protein
MDLDLILAHAQQLSAMLDGPIEALDDLGNLVAKLSTFAQMLERHTESSGSQYADILSSLDVDRCGLDVLGHVSVPADYRANLDVSIMQLRTMVREDQMRILAPAGQ